MDIWDTLPAPERKGGRVVEGAGLENRNTGNGIGGSNPFPSAIFNTKVSISFTFARMERWPSG